MRLTGFLGRLGVDSSIGRDFVLNAGSNLLLAAIGVVTGSLLARQLGPEGRGQLAAIQLLAMFLLTLGALGVENGLVYYAGRRVEEVGSLVTSVWAILLPGSIFWIGLGYILVPIFLRNWDPNVVTFARLSLLLLPLAYFNRAVWAVKSLKRFDAWIIHKWHKPLLYLGLLVVLWVTGTASPYTVAVGFIIISAVGPVLTLYLLRWVGIRLAVPSLGRIGELLHYGIRSVLGTLPQELNLRLDQFLMVLWLGQAELGLYVAAVSWSLALNPLISAVDTVAFPYVAASPDLQSQRRFFAASVRISFVSILLANVLLIAITPMAIPLLFGADFADAVPVGMVLVLASSLYALKTVLSSGLRGLGFPEATAYAEVASLVCMLILLVLLLPRLGIMGAALASFSAYMLSALILLLFARARASLSLHQMLVVTPSDLRAIRHRMRSPFQATNSVKREGT